MGRKPLFVAEAPASICCSKEVKKKKKKENARADLNTFSLHEDGSSVLHVFQLSYRLRLEERLRTKENIIKRSSCVCFSCFYIEADWDHPYSF